MELLALVTFTFLFVPTSSENSSECCFMMEGGDELILQCQVADVDLSAKPLDVTRPDLKHEGRDVVHAYRHQQDFLTDQMDQCKGRTTLSHEDLKKGTITLRISSVDPSDSGRYRIFVPRLFVCYINITVVTDQQNLTQTDNTSTSGPPVEDVTEPDAPDAGNMTDRNDGVVIGVPVAVAAAAVVVVVVVVLVKLGQIKICKKTLSGPTGREADLNSNDPEEGTLMTPETNNSHSTAQNGLMTFTTASQLEETHL